jgi:hypothetical protein
MLSMPNGQTVGKKARDKMQKLTARAVVNMLELVK